MNKALISTVIACGLLLLDTPAAAAHETRDYRQRSIHYDSYDRVGYRATRHERSYDRSHDRHHDYSRSHHMPRWLQHDSSFGHWFEHTHLRRNRHISWHQMFEFYIWDRPGYRYRKH